MKEIIRLSYLRIIGANAATGDDDRAGGDHLKKKRAVAFARLAPSSAPRIMRTTNSANKRSDTIVVKKSSGDVGPGLGLARQRR